VDEEAPTREELEARWQELWARREEQKERHARLLASLATIEDAIGRRALAQLEADQIQLEADLRELRADMERNGTFE
jgi:hypothetical protein